MKDKSWIIIAIMGLALIISVSYSIVVSQRKANAEKTVTTTSIIEMTATTATIKNTLTGKGTVLYREKEINQNIDIQSVNTEDNVTLESQTNTVNNEQNKLNENNNMENFTNNQELPKTYQITLSIEDRDVKKVKIDQDVEISIQKEEKVLNYTGKVIKVKEALNNKSTLDVEITNSDENIEENQIATCTIIVEKAENAVALPIEAIQKDEEQKTYVDLVVEDGTTKAYIKTGISDDYYVEITEGLKVGDRVQIIKSSTTVVNGNETNLLNNISSGK